MRLSKTSEYALRILSFMVNHDAKVFSAKFLIKTLDVPDKYLRRLMTDLSKKGFIKSSQGRDGGYVFAKSPDTIFLSEVIDAVEGMEKYYQCLLGFGNCNYDNPCALHHKFAPVKNEFLRLLSTTTIQELTKHEIGKY